MSPIKSTFGFWVGLPSFVEPRMLRGKAAIMAVIILTALIVAYHWRKGAGTVVVPVALLASYAVWRWRRED